MLDQIIPAQPHHIDAIVKLLNEVTLELHRKGIAQWKYPWVPIDIEPDVIKGNVYLVMIDSQIIGTFSLKDAVHQNFPISTPSLYLYRIAISPKFQGKNIGLEIIANVKKHSQALNKPVYLDCWAGNEKLRQFYLNAGFEYIGDFPEENYAISVFKYK
jgi:RimJ/RimL family protein N-acetyltransferase